MNSTNKILITGLILMVVLNFCTLGYVIFFRSGHECSHGKGQRVDKGEFLKKKLHFSDSQGIKLDSIRKFHEEKMQALRDKKNTIRKKISAIIKKDPFDSSTIDVPASEIGECHKEMEVQMALYFSSVKKLCTTDQIEYFNEFVDHMAERKHKWREGIGPHKKDKRESQEF